MGSVRGDKGFDRGDFVQRLIWFILIIMEGTPPLRGEPYPTL